MRDLSATKTPFGTKKCPRVSGPKITRRPKHSILHSRKNSAAHSHGFSSEHKALNPT